MPMAQPMTPCTGTGSGRLLAQVMSKMAEATLQRRRAKLEVQWKKGSKGQVASDRGGRRQVGWKGQAFPTKTHGEQTPALALPSCVTSGTIQNHSELQKDFNLQNGKNKSCDLMACAWGEGSSTWAPVQVSPYMTSPLHYLTGLESVSWSAKRHQ